MTHWWKIVSRTGASLQNILAVKLHTQAICGWLQLFFAYWLIFKIFCHLLFSKSIFSINYLRNTFRVLKSLDPEQARCFIGPGLGPNVCKIHQQMTPVGKELNHILFKLDKIHIYRGSYMSAHVLLNLLNELAEKETKCKACLAFYLFSATSLINSIIQEHQC